MEAQGKGGVSPSELAPGESTLDPRVKPSPSPEVFGRRWPPPVTSSRARRDGPCEPPEH